MKKLLLAAAIVFNILNTARSQELYVFSEPASNMPSKTIGVKLTAIYPNAGSFTQRYKPELMVGINKNWMVHLSSTLSNYYTNNTRFESGKVYAKYRFYSDDDVHKHFRMAAFADVALTRNPYLYDEINLDGDNDGAQIGLIATKLVNKLAVSGTVSYTRFFPARKDHQQMENPSLNGSYYSLSAGYLVLPKEYVSYSQPNLNLYVELLGNQSLDKRHYAVDLAPAAQLILNSNTKINFGYRFQVVGNMSRMAESSWLIGLEHTIFNVWK